ncbi:MFS transporter [Legionella sp. D16C41]|uniref:MFS transporter n=1 Tax=Legionella sp. D16C41 TaxID=3402688 RepID=UPI003AF8EC87
MVTSLIFLAIGMFAVGCNTFLIAGLLPLIGETINQSIAVTGQGITLFSLTYLLSALLFTVLLANKPIKAIIQFALTLFILGNLITLLAENLAIFLIGRMLAGVGAGIFTPLCITLAVHVVKTSAKGRGLGFIWSANSAGVVFGTPIGLYLSSVFNWQLSMAYIIMLSLIALIGLALQNADIKLPNSQLLGNELRLLINKKTLSVIGISCFTASASLGLFSYITLLQSGSAHSLTMILFSWGLGGFIGSSLVGIIIDCTQKPQGIMALVLLGLALTILSIPFTKNLPYIGLIPFFMWGVFGWATTNPQQQILFELYQRPMSILAAINTSAFGLGAALGTSLGGLILTSGFKESYLPFPAAMLLLAVFICQLTLIKNSNREHCI